MHSTDLLHRIANAAANAAAGIAAAGLAAVWLAVGGISSFPPWWQTTLYSATAMVTFVMVFVIHHTQGKQVAGLQRKLDELIRSTNGADNALISVEQAPQVELEQLAEHYRVERIDSAGR